MKKHQVLFLALMSWAISFISEAADDPCGDDACQNGGMCQDADTANPWCDCPYSYTGEFCESILTTGDLCVRDCTNKENGNYQNCRRCGGIFVACTDGELEEDFCDDDDEWHEADKMCKSGSSDTCDLKIVSPSELNANDGNDGPCSDNDPCQNGATCVNNGALEEASCTCPYTYTGDYCESVLSTGDDCVRSCTGVEDGDYQNCRECDIYVKCEGGQLMEASCGNGQEWDNTVNSCQENPAGVCELQLVDPQNGAADIMFGKLTTPLCLGLSIVFYELTC